MPDMKKQQQLAKILTYVLGRRPDEFGLVPDEEGYVKIKELIKAMHEEDGWRHVRLPLIEELLVILPDPGIEIKEDLIRAADTFNLPKLSIPIDLPKNLYTCVTNKSYPHIIEEGISPTWHKYVILASNPELAGRIGNRRGKDPVLITVNTLTAEDAGTVFYSSGELLFCTDYISPGCFAGPLLPKQKPAMKKAAIKPKPEPVLKSKTPGSFELDLEKAPVNPKGEKGSWKRDKKRLRREKKKGWDI